MAAATKPMVSEMRAPYMMRMNWSRPSASVPQGWAQLGPAFMFM